MALKKYTFFKFIILIILTFIISVGSYWLYLRLPTELDIVLSSPLTDETLSTISYKSVNINNDPYASSTYRPDDPLYKPVLAIQQKRWSEAIEMLKPMAEQGNSTAMFWLGDITYSANAFSDGGKWFVRAAELGNPYAALRLSPSLSFGYDCDRWLKAYCDSKWDDIGLKGLLKLAQGGDSKAAYVYLYFTRFKNTSSEFYFDLIDVVKIGMDNNYYRPLQYLANLYLSRESLNPFNNDPIPLSEDEKAVIFNSLMVAAKNNDVLSMRLINNRFKEFSESSSDFGDLVGNSQLLFDGNNFLTVFDYFIRGNSNTNRDSLIRGYSIANLFDYYIKDFNQLGEYKGIFEYMLMDSNIKPMTEEEKSQGMIMTKNLIGHSTPVIFIDEVTGTSPLFH